MDVAECVRTGVYDIRLEQGTSTAAKCMKPLPVGQKIQVLEPSAWDCDFK